MNRYADISLLILRAGKPGIVLLKIAGICPWKFCPQIDAQIKRIASGIGPAAVKTT